MHLKGNALHTRASCITSTQCQACLTREEKPQVAQVCGKSPGCQCPSDTFSGHQPRPLEHFGTSKESNSRHPPPQRVQALLPLQEDWASGRGTQSLPTHLPAQEASSGEVIGLITCFGSFRSKHANGSLFALES